MCRLCRFAVITKDRPDGRPYRADSRRTVLRTVLARPITYCRTVRNGTVGAFNTEWVPLFSNHDPRHRGVRIRYAKPCRASGQVVQSVLVNRRRAVIGVTTRKTDVFSAVP